MEIGPEKLIESLEKGNPEVISLPTLQYLMKVLPDAEEVRTSSILVSNGQVKGILNENNTKVSFENLCFQKKNQTCFEIRRFAMGFDYKKINSRDFIVVYIN